MTFVSRGTKSHAPSLGGSGMGPGCLVAVVAVCMSASAAAGVKDVGVVAGFGRCRLR